MPDYTILVIDYDPRSIRRVQQTLVDAGHHVEVAKDGEAGIEAFERIRPDLTLVEAMIPKVHGFEVCQRLKQTDHGKRSPVVIITAVYKGRKYRHEARHKYRCDGYLEKPISDIDLVGAVHTFLSIGRTASLSPGPTASDAKPEA